MIRVKYIVDVNEDGFFVLVRHQNKLYKIEYRNSINLISKEVKYDR